MYKNNVVFLFSCLKYAIIFFIGCFACCIMFSLITFYPFDDSYFQFTGNNIFYNVCGKLGAIFSDILFFMFGLPAYIFPCIILFLVGDYFLRKKFDFWNMAYKIFGGIILLFSLCGLVEFFINDFYYCRSGGIIGILLRGQILYMLNDTVINIILVLFMVLGVILLIQYLWLVVLNSINVFVFKFIVYCYMCVKCCIRNKYLEIFFLKIWGKIHQSVICIYVYLILFIKEYLAKYIHQWSGMFLQIIFCIKHSICNNSIINFFHLLFEKYFFGNKSDFVYRFRFKKGNFTNVLKAENMAVNPNCFNGKMQNLNYKNTNGLFYNNFKNKESVQKKKLV